MQPSTIIQQSFKVCLFIITVEIIYYIITNLSVDEMFGFSVVPPCFLPGHAPVSVHQSGASVTCSSWPILWQLS